MCRSLKSKTELQVEATIQRLTKGLGLVDLKEPDPVTSATVTRGETSSQEQPGPSSCEAHLQEYQVLLAELQNVRLALVSSIMIHEVFISRLVVSRQNVQL